MMVFISNGKKLHVSAYSSHLQVLTTFFLKKVLYIMPKPNRHPTKFSLTKAHKMMMRSQHHHAVKAYYIHNSSSKKVVKT